MNTEVGESGSNAGDTFHGLERIVSSRGDMLIHFRQALNIHRQNGFKRSVTTKFSGGEYKLQTYLVPYPHADFADTFFSDTLLPDDLANILKAAKEHNVPCRFLFLNPLSDQSRVRAMMLAASSAERRKQQSVKLSEDESRAIENARNWVTIDQNRKLRNEVLDSMDDVTLGRTLVGITNLAETASSLGTGKPPEPASESKSRGVALRQQLRNELVNLTKFEKEHDPARFKIEVRFTSELMLLPMYIFGDYLYRGILMPRSSAVHKPWSIYRDDPGRSDDVFSVSKEAFEQVWNSSLPTALFANILEQDAQMVRQSEEAKRTIMVAYSEDNKWALDQVERVIREVSRDRVVPIHYAFESDTSSVSRDVIERLLGRATAGIALLLNDETVQGLVRRRDAGKIDTKPRNRSRLNVSHEMGMMQARFGFDRVLLLRESDGGSYDEPSNIQGMNKPKVPIAESGGQFDEDVLTGVIVRFLNDLKLLGV